MAPDMNDYYDDDDDYDMSEEEIMRLAHQEYLDSEHMHFEIANLELEVRRELNLTNAMMLANGPE
jgi:hypothetical protein